MVYDRQRLGWWEFSTGASCFSEYKDTTGQPRLYFGDSKSGKVYYFDPTSKKDDTMTIVTSWLSPKFKFDDYAQSKFFLFAELYFGKTPGEITISVYIDGELNSSDTKMIGNKGQAGMGLGTMGTETIGVGDGSLDIVDNGGGDFILIPINAIGRNVQIGIEDNTGDKSWELNSLSFNFKPLNQIYQPNTQ
jgi:hypothetical protein